MSAPRAGTAAAVLALACLLAGGCGTRAAPGAGTALAAATATPAPLAASATGPAGAGWVVVPMGGPAAQEDEFWELFVRPSASARWRLATPAGVADNGGLEVAGTGAFVVTGFRPSQDLTFSPLAVSTDGGANWSPAGPVSPGLAAEPGALAASPDGGLLALTSGGRAEAGARTGTVWTALTSARALGAAPAGAACAPSGLTAAAYSRSGAAVLAASCRHPGTVGIFTRSGHGWTATGPTVPRSLADADISVLRLAGSGSGLVALVRAVSRAGTSLIAAWSDGPGGPWRWSAPLSTGTRSLRSTSAGPDGTVAVLLSGGRAETIAGQGSRWQVLPPVPASTAALTVAPGGRVDAIAAHGQEFTDWQLTAGSAGRTPAPAAARWRAAQTIHVTIPYGSSG
jgi:hypothetical protein